LNVWGTNLTDEEFDILSRNIKTTSKNAVKFVYTEIKTENYEKELLDSFINSESPDIFLMNNEQIGKFKKLVSPLDLSQKNYNINNFRKEYPTIIEEEAILDGKLYMLPFSIDSLALYYNRNIFDSLSIPTPPST
jgi:multiple sugar transport system substrate-binding protein